MIEIIKQFNLRIRYLRLLKARKIILKELDSCIKENYRKTNCQNLIKADDILKQHEILISIRR
ncbi:hypothetical protein [Clostridium saccharoperbutylacetonicum]|uniref:hypothetical protein n=1 Tax=Clostridium saccharoperbutylacetonicum TaxID=36745 RepID=UPI0039EC30C9